MLPINNRILGIRESEVGLHSLQHRTALQGILSGIQSSTKREKSGTRNAKSLKMFRLSLSRVILPYSTGYSSRLASRPLSGAGLREDNHPSKITMR